jgi:hypothetical protein
MKQGYILSKKENGMNNQNNVISCSDMITHVFSNIERKDLENSNRVISSWSSILKSIKAKNYETGQNLAAHSRVIDLKNGVLLVEADHPGWIELLHLYTKYILTGLNRAVPELTIDTLSFRLKGSRAELASAAADPLAERRKIEKKLENEEKELQSKGFSEVDSSNSVKKKDLPLELKNLFDQLRNDMLTNPK